MSADKGNDVMWGEADGDDFVFEWSDDGTTYHPAVTVTSTVDDDSYETAAIPASVVGTLSLSLRGSPSSADAVAAGSGGGVVR